MATLEYIALLKNNAMAQDLNQVCISPEIIHALPKQGFLVATPQRNPLVIPELHHTFN